MRVNHVPVAANVLFMDGHVAFHVGKHIFAPGEEGIESGFYQSVPWPGSNY
ncbi:MAG: hypothetical protein HYV27_03975 [Candidatus Hydrogenedentes bacterium]|nr:hypothetical protein [Candidatus Hydrogenedentota bacterium]